MTEKIKKELLEVAGYMYQKGMVNAFEGNLSIRKRDTIYITPSSICKGFLKKEMIVVTDLNGKVLEGEYKPSSEIKLHLAIYEHKPELKSVIHAHSPYATAFAVANKPIETKAYPEMIVLFDKIPLAAYGAPSTDDIYKGVLEYLPNYDIILMANHGIVAVGIDAFDAFFKLESAESIAKMLIIVQQLGGAKDLSEEQLEVLYKMRRERL